MATRISQLPEPPQRSDPANFSARGDAFLAAMPGFGGQANALADEVNTDALAAADSAAAAGQYAADAQAAAGDAQTAADAAAADALKTAADRQAVEDALVDGPVISVNGRSGIVTGLMEAQGGTATGLKFSVLALGNITGATEIDLAVAQEFTATVTGNVTFSFTNAPAADESQVVYLRLINAGAFTITWPAGTKFAEAEAPTFTASGVDLIGVKYDQTTSTYMVFVIGLEVA